MKPDLCTLAVLLLAVSFAVAQAPPEALNDAELSSVTFVDSDTGWAVGDRGVIWHTIDSGRTWQRQDSDTQARLNSISFIDAEHGWAAGAVHRPYTHAGLGVVLRTADGGRTWQSIPNTNLPALKYVKFFSVRQGVAVGESSAFFPGGVFTTADGGRSWSSLVLPGEVSGIANQSGSLALSDWQFGAFLNPLGGIVGNRHQIGAINGQEIQTLNGIASERQPLCAVALSKTGMAWFAGDNGFLVGVPTAPGQQRMLPKLPAAAARMQLRAIATLGTHLWVLGRPGTLVFHSPDEGQTWETFRTETAVPLSSLCFTDDKRGWAVGALGTILGTRDGGRTWRMQRQGAARTALLAIFSQAERIPHELLVQQAGNEGYVSAVELLTEPASLDCAREGVSHLLASHTDVISSHSIPRSHASASLEQLLQAWSAHGNAQVLEQIEQELVQRIRTWRPDVIMTDDADPSGKQPLAHLTNQLVLSAVAKAAEPSAFKYQVEELGLAPWKVTKVFAATDDQGDLKLVCSQLAPRLGASLADVADNARSQLADRYELTRSTRGFRLLVDQLPQGQGRRDFFSGIAIPPGSDARRPLSHPPVPDFTSLSKQIQKRQLLQDLLQRSHENPIRGNAWLVQATEMTRGLPPPTAGRVMYLLGERYHASGEAEFAAEIMKSLAEKQPDHPLAESANQWLMRYYASGEMANRQPKANPDVQPAIVTDDPVELQNPMDEIELASATQRVKETRRIDQAVMLAKSLERTKPVVAAGPELRFLLASATTKLANASPLERERHLQSLASHRAAGAWAECAKAELWIAKPDQGRPSKRLLTSKAAAQKPKLDGRLDDPIWQSALPVSLRESEGNVKPLDTIVAILYDAEFLYLGASCQRSDRFSYQPDNRVRQRDSALSAQDRIEIRLDIDRDYTTSYHLTIDHRGWANDVCFGDATWNPNWFIAASGNETHWTVEAAIPLSELTSTSSVEDAFWAIGLERVIPAVDCQGWSTALDLGRHPEQMGLLRFE